MLTRVSGSRLDRHLDSALMPAPAVREPAGGGSVDAVDYSRVSVIMTALDEGRHLAASVRSVLTQDYPGELELVVAVGPSSDRTLDLANELAASSGGRMRVVLNPSGRTPAGLNLAIAATDPRSAVIVRTDGHANLGAAYVRCAVEALKRTGAANVGGMMVPEGTTAFEQAVARAMSRRIGLGSAPFHIGGAPGPADTVYLGVFRRSALADVGGFDEEYVRAQDWELNYRIRRGGGVVWFDPGLQVSYRPRPNAVRLARQFHMSGVWRWQIMQRRPDTVSVRYLAAPAATLALLMSAVAAALAGRRGHRGLRTVGRAVPAGYLGVIVAGAAVTRRGLSPAATAAYPVALMTMHLAWGAGFLRAAAVSAARRLLRR